MAGRKYLTTTLPAAPPVPGPEEWGSIYSEDLAPLPPGVPGGGGGSGGTPGTGTPSGDGSGPWIPVLQPDGSLVYVPVSTLPGGGGETGGVWIGEVREFSADTVPPGWLRADGREVSISSYPALYARYGNGTRYPTPPASPGKFRVVDKTPAEVAFEMGDDTSRFYVWSGVGESVTITCDSTIVRVDSTLYTMDNDGG